VKEGKNEMKFGGTLLLAKGNKARLDMASEIQGQKHKFTLISDGAKVRTGSGVEAKGTVEDTPKNANAIFAGVATRAGVWDLTQMQPLKLDKVDPKQVKLEDLVTVADFSVGKKEKIRGRQALRIDYKLTLNFRGVKETLDAQLWLDSETNLPLQRTLSGKALSDKEDEGEIRLTETYDIRVNGKIEASKFQLPK
jgi:outer membrane lipoprotein-sorting protein